MQEKNFLGQSTAFLDSVDRVSRAAPLNRPVLVIGERGTGKELVAERLHRLSQRWDGPFVAMNCAALTETLIEAELFGHEAGAFTGATKAREGRFEGADGGTLFLDELGTLSSAAQERLLRAVEYGEVTRIGSNRPVRVDVRIVAATNANLPDRVQAGQFRADLLDRLSFEVITLPPLRHRDGDVAVLATHFAQRMAVELGWPGWPGFDDEAMAEMEAHAWPGNIRELRNVVERAVYRWDDPALPVGHIIFDPFHSPWSPESGRAPEEPSIGTKYAKSMHIISDFKASVAAYEKQLLGDALTRHKHNQRATAKSLSLSYDQLRHALRRHGLLEGVLSTTDYNDRHLVTDG
jgi:psp operon transcriptional activator